MHSIRLRYDYDTTVTKINMFIFAHVELEAGAQYVVVIS